jgi:hypothetical protein
MGICGIFFEIFDHIDLEIIAFEGKKQRFFRPYPVGSTAFDSRLHHFIEVHEAKLLEVHNVWHVR